MALSFLLQVFLLVSTSFHTHLPEWGCKFITQAHRERQTLGEFETLPRGHAADAPQGLACHQPRRIHGAGDSEVCSFHPPSLLRDLVKLHKMYTRAKFLQAQFNYA